MQMNFEQIREEINKGKLLTCIHGNIYDITNFISQHPGGKRIIKNCIGIDATCLFESYHPFTQTPHSYLKSMKVGTVANYISPSKFNTSFAISLKNKCKQFMKNKSLRECKSNYIIIFISITIGILSHILFLFFPNIISALFVAISMTYCLFASHLSSHYILSSHEWINDIVSYMGLLYPFGWGDNESWSSFHVISHHSYLNTSRDYEQEGANYFKSEKIINSKFALQYFVLGLLSAAAPAICERDMQWNIFRFDNKYDFKKILPAIIMMIFAHVFFYFAFMLVALQFIKLGVLLMLLKLQRPLNSDNDGVGPYIFVFNNDKDCQYYYTLKGLSHWVYLILFYYINMHYISPIKLIFLFALVVFETSFLFSLLQNPLHTHINNKNVFDTDWYKHQIINTSSTSVKYGNKINRMLQSIVGCGFSINHAAHHCFPGISVQHLYGLEKIIEQHCKENHVTFTPTSSCIDLYKLLAKKA
eukprot:454474_1